MAIKVMSQNVLCGEKKSPFSARLPLMRKALRDHGAAVIGLQEVTPAWKEMLDQLLPEFESALMYRCEESPEAVSVYWDPRVVTAVESGHFWLSETPEVSSLGWDGRYPRVTSWACFEEKATGKRFAFVNTHLDHRGEMARREGIKLICRFVKQRFGADMPLVLMGDFNARPDSPTIATANDLLKDSRHVAKCSTDAPTLHDFGQSEPRIIDYIYLTDNMNCTSFDIVRESDGQTCQSDHNGLIAQIEL